MNILILSGSPRKGGNTEIMAETFAEGAREAGHDATVKAMSGLSIAPCLGCMYCFEHDGECVQKDDMTDIYRLFEAADMFVFASPIYWFAMSAQTRAATDRLFAFYSKGYHPTKTALLLNAQGHDVFDSSIAQYRDICKAVGWQDMGIITISGLEEKGSIRKSPDLKKVYELGCSL